MSSARRARNNVNHHGATVHGWMKKIWTANWGGKIGVVAGVVAFVLAPVDEIVANGGVIASAVSSIVRFVTGGESADEKTVHTISVGIVGALMVLVSGIAGALVGGLIKIAIKKLTGKKDAASVEHSNGDDEIHGSRKLSIKEIGMITLATLKGLPYALLGMIGIDVEKTARAYRKNARSFDASIKKNKRGMRSALRRVGIKHEVKHGSFVDPRDGQSYRTVEIGGKTWLAQNLNYQTEDSWHYDDDPINGKKYGRLYTWDAAMSAAPDGWHLATDEEWRGLMEAVGGICTYPNGDGPWSNGASAALRTKDKWLNAAAVGTDEYGFSALPGGRGGAGITSIGFSEICNYGYWWSALERDSEKARAWYMSNRSSIVDNGWKYKTSAYSVRCVMD